MVIETYYKFPSNVRKLTELRITLMDQKSPIIMVSMRVGTVKP
jgi:hypothetical protein